jgi:hypothetical protein
MVYASSSTIFTLEGAFARMNELILCFLAGWIAVAGFQIRGNILIAAPFLFTAWLLVFRLEYFLDRIRVSAAMEIWVTAGLIVAASVLILWATGHIEVKCS